MELKKEKEEWESSRRDKSDGLDIKEGKDESFDMKENKKMLLSLQEDNASLRHEIVSLKDDIERSNKEFKDLERQVRWQYFLPRVNNPSSTWFSLNVTWKLA